MTAPLANSRRAIQQRIEDIEIELADRPVMAAPTAEHAQRVSKLSAELLDLSCKLGDAER